MKVLGRFVVRETDDPNDGLIIGNLTQHGKALFQPGEVIEIRLDSGHVAILNIGESCIPKDLQHIKEGGCNSVSWGSSVGHVLRSIGKYLTWTLEEFRNRCSNQ